MALFYGWGSTASRLKPLGGGILLFTTKSPEIPGIYSIYRPRKDERLSRTWSHPVVLNTGPLDSESSALTTRLLLQNPSMSDFHQQIKKYPPSKIPLTGWEFLPTP